MGTSPDALTAAAASPAFWTAVASIMVALITAAVTIHTARRTARIAERKDAATVGVEVQAALNSSFKMFSDTSAQMLAAFQAERTVMLDEIKGLKKQIGIAIAHIKKLERAVRDVGGDPPPRPDGVD